LGLAGGIGAARLKTVNAAQDDRDIFHASLHVHADRIVMTMQYRTSETRHFLGPDSTSPEIGGRLDCFAYRFLS